MASSTLLFHHNSRKKKKNIGKANTFLVSGAAMQQIVMTPLLRYLLAVYSFRGTLLIYGAIMLNGLVAVSFFHPIKWHLRLSSGEKPQPQQEALLFFFHIKSTAHGKTQHSYCLLERSKEHPKEDQFSCADVLISLF